MLIDLGNNIKGLRFITTTGRGSNTQVGEEGEAG
jgi:hypothetical protein